MQSASLLLKKIIRSSVLPFAAQHGMKKDLFPLSRTLSLSLFLKQDNSCSPSEKLDLDAWKKVMKSGLQEEVNETVSEHKEPATLAAAREMLEMWRLAGKSVPENITEEQLKTFMECTSKSAQKKYLKYLYLKELHKKNDKRKMEEKRERRLEAQEQASETGVTKKNSFICLWANCMDKVCNWRAAQSMVFGQPLVFDMSFEKDMSVREVANTVRQIVLSESTNRRSIDPFHIHFCNFKDNSLYHKEFIKHYREAWGKLLITVTDQCYTEVFPKEKLIYLTADSPKVMKTFDHNKIYIVGSMVDRNIKTGVSLARAKRLGLETAALPLEKYLLWNTGAKNLTLDQMMHILLTLKDTGDWQKALEFVPKRKYCGFVNKPVHELKKTLSLINTLKLGKRQEEVRKQFAKNYSKKQTQK
ncbi:tRNA methyltransferase 10 homolog C [Pezoporus wallicus]|uniref:tRNA methyltransferase 10 homolog C n=1 Tax=Pezoporus wallicus TaxID=35540 RepID=UPI0025518EAC|nr:tRNA methyltransferase 10 homolog C [Pezoporus wallicus]XP_057268986.1 tRNA methyltransferase 10 homolog C [Pezoporus wallicus]XP_061310458.1 tRNA methyltransferase 10 homolog C [Pezoporus flaviventris]XP_061310459.1 tRNA methyltransferase 10 homolog C [Pezoporus flaviventris]XP_061310460.1 tRNA methyltransferase 10 homolog C [Pezoporus flaviventris]XP_061310461.1 tRNA methyltransferase 10 homolog C [Pezoporus flaviventris]